MKQITDFSDIHAHGNPAPDRIVSVSVKADTRLPADGFFSVGIHLWDTPTTTEADLDRVAQLAAHQSVVAIGECGLDALRGADLATQEKIFRAQVAISESSGKPLIIHAVRTLQRLIELRKELRPKQRWVIHGFRGKPQLAQSLLRAGFDLSFGKKFNPDSLELTPPDRRFYETDM